MSRSLLAFKAGRLHRRENTNWLDPSSTKGLIQLVIPDDGLLHFQWQNRTNGIVEEDLIIFPHEASFEKVQQSSEGRTYVLKFTSSNQRHFFWLQSVSTEHDSELISKVNGILHDATWEDTEAEAEAEAEAEIEATGPSETHASTSASALAQAPTEQQLSELRNILSQISQDPEASGASHTPELSLEDVLTPNNLAPLFSSPELVQHIFPHLPSDLPVPPSAEALQRIIESPQFHAAVRSLDQALSTGLLGGLVRGLGLPEEAGTGVGPFLRAIKEQSQRDGGDDRMETD